MAMPDPLPMFLVKQAFSRPVVADVPAAVSAQLATLELGRRVKRGQRVGVAVGSRGIRNLVPVLRATVEHLRRLGAEPCLLAAMGSHGGGTESGQAEVLASLGVTEAAVGAPVRTCAEAVQVGVTPGGVPVHTLRAAREVDAILLVNRVKAHTSFRGHVESGLVKQLVVGLGGPRGAQQFHGFGPGELSRLLLELSEVLLGALPVVGGLALVESAYEETAAVRALPARGMADAEAELLAWSKSLSPALPAQEIDLLLVEEMGKNFSGTGIDTNVVGRARIQGVPEPTRPAIKRIGVLDLSEESHGNATGVGLADLVTQRLVDRIDREKTYLNCLTSTFVLRAALPMWFDTERALFEAALYSLSGVEPAALRVVLIPNTLFLEESYVSAPIARELAGRGVEVDPAPRPLAFDASGRLTLRLGRR